MMMSLRRAISGPCCSKFQPSAAARQLRIGTQLRAPRLLPPSYGVPGGLKSARYGVLSRASAVEAPEGLKIADWTGTPAQVEALAEVEARMKSCEYGVPSTATCEWFLRDRTFDVDEAVEKLTTMMQWRKEFGVDDLSAEMVADEAATGKAEIWKHTDKFGRPVVLVRADRHVIGEVPPEDSKRLCIYVLENGVEQAKADGVDLMLGVFDLSKFKTRNADLGFITFLIEALLTYYPKRCSQVLFVNAPWVFQPAWLAIKPLLFKYGSLVRFVSSKEVLEEYFTEDTCPPEFLAK